MSDPSIKLLANEIPLLKHPRGRRLAVITTRPTSREILANRPLIDTLVWKRLAPFGIDRNHCFAGNICQSARPHIISINTEHVRNGLGKLRIDLEAFQPHFCLLLGSMALESFLGHPGEIKAWRGSLFRAANVVPGVKCLATYSHQDVLADYRLGALVGADLKRVAAELETDEMVLPSRDVVTFCDHQSGDEVLSLLDNLHKEPIISFDIEGYVWNITHFGVSWERGAKALSIPFYRDDKLPRWREEEFADIWSAIRGLMTDTSVAKVAHNSMYDLFAIRYGQQIEHCGEIHDTMLSWWELYGEQDKDLNTVAATLTSQPCWNVGLRTASVSEVAHYNAIDCAVTLESHIKIIEQLKGTGLDHYNFNRSLLPALLKMSCRGIRYNFERAPTMLAEVRRELFTVQDELDYLAGCKSPTKAILRELCINKRYRRQFDRGGREETPELLEQYVNSSMRKVWDRGLQLAPLLETDPAARGELGQLLELSINVHSTTQLTAYLVDELKLEPYLHRQSKAPTFSTEFLQKMHKRKPHKALKLILKLRGLETEVNSLLQRCDPDGRVRAAYNLVSNAEGEPACYESPTGTGYNLRTITKRHRCLLQADHGKLVANVSFENTDLWTVAAHCSALGDESLLKNLKLGMYRHEDDLGIILPTVYMAKHIGSRSNDFKQAQADFLATHPGVERWHEQAEKLLSQVGSITSASGAKRVFFGRKKESTPGGNFRTCVETLRDWLAHEPRANIAYSTMLTLYKLWNDSTNWIDGHPIVEPLHVTKDSLWSQFPVERKEWALVKLNEWATNQLQIAGVQITVPCAVGVGENFPT